jgi:putative salt-induced outer membrane protein
MPPRMHGVLLAALLPLAAPAAEPTSPWSGEATAGLVRTSGNSDSTTANARLQVVYTAGRWRNTFDTGLIKTEQVSQATGLEEVTAERYFVGNKADFSLTERDYVFVALEYEKDLVGPIRQRTSETAGYGRKVLTGPEHRLELELGAGARQTETQVVIPSAPVAVEDEDLIGRGRLAYKWQFGETSHAAETVKAESGQSNTYVESVSELRLALVGRLYAQASYTVRSNTDVPPGARKTDTITAFSLGWSFGA